MEIAGIALAAAIASIAFLYQKAWERRERRLEKYEAVMDALPGILVDSRDPEKIDRMLSFQRHLWLSAPAAVVRAFNDLFLAAQVGRKASEEETGAALAAFVFAARKDASLLSAIFPAKAEQLKTSDIRLMRASR